MTDLRSNTSYSPGGPVVLAPPDPRWADDFAREAGAIRAALSDLAIAVHHIGSTAVDGLIAKPVIDILLVVPHLAPLDARADRLAALGYDARGEFGIPGRRYFHKTSPLGVRTHQIHAYAEESDAIRRHLDFRDYLRAHPATAEAYARLKVRLADRFHADVEGYAHAKTPFVLGVERDAVRWRLRIDDREAAV
jgi:GrpB-like predicted nucleotidyltransferase (UPF0157 family)